MAKASVYYTLSSVEGKHDVKQIKKALDALPGVESVSVNQESDRVAVDFDTSGILSSRIQKELEKSGYEILESSLDTRMQEGRK